MDASGTRSKKCVRLYATRVSCRVQLNLLGDRAGWRIEATSRHGTSADSPPSSSLPHLLAADNAGPASAAARSRFVSALAVTHAMP